MTLPLSYPPAPCQQVTKPAFGQGKYEKARAFRTSSSTSTSPASSVILTPIDENEPPPFYRMAAFSYFSFTYAFSSLIFSRANQPSECVEGSNLIFLSWLSAKSSLIFLLTFS